MKFVAEAFSSNWIAPAGPQLDLFERRLAAYLGVKRCVALNSGTAAIHLALRAAGVGPGDVVFCSTFTFVGSVAPIMYLGAIPVFIDSDPDTWNLSPTALAQAFGDAERTGSLPKVVLVVDVYGLSANMEPIKALCERYGATLVEDAAESLGGKYHTKPCGTFGRLNALSFNGNKIITTSGGGAVSSDDEELLEKIRFWSLHARERGRFHVHREIGQPYRLSNVCAAIGLGQLTVLDERVRARRANYATYRKTLAEIPYLQFMPEPEGFFSTRWMTAITIDPTQSSTTRDQLMDALESENIEARPLWLPQHRQPVFEKCRYYPHSDAQDISGDLYAHGLCLPSGSNLSALDIDRVIECVRKRFSRTW